MKRIEENYSQTILKEKMKVLFIELNIFGIEVYLLEKLSKCVF